MTDVQGRGRLSRGQFLAGAVSAGGAAAAAGVLAVPAAGQKQSPGACATGRRAYGAGHYGVEMDGLVSDVFWSDGGPPTGVVLGDGQTGPEQIQKKHVAAVKYNDFSVQMGMGAGKGVYEWIKASLDKGGEDARKSGSIIYLDRESTEASRSTFPEALITEVGFPALDADSKDDAYLSVHFGSAATQKTVAGKYPIGTRKQKSWLCSNFRLRIDGLDTSRVASIDSFTWKCSVAVDEARRRPVRVPGKLEIPNLVFSVPETDAAPVQEWLRQLVAAGADGDKYERNADVVFLAPDNRTVFATVSFGGVGVFKVSPEKVEAGSEAIRRVKCELYCESMSVAFGDAASS